MAHYALLDENNIVFNVIVGEDESDDIDWEKEYQKAFGLRCKRTSYNTYANEHSQGGTPFRKNYAIIGGIYDEELDAFYAQQPYPSWTLNTETCIWEAPVEIPIDPSYFYAWDEDAQEWIPVKEVFPS